MLNRYTQVIIQGLTTPMSELHTHLCMEYGTHVVAGVSYVSIPWLNLPMYDTVEEACRRHRVDATLIFEEKTRAKEAIIEAILAKIPLIVCTTEGIPVWDMLEIKQMLAQSKSKLIGPNSAGVIKPKEVKLGIMPDHLYTAGSLAILARSGTLMHEAVHQLNQFGIGQSCCVSIGGDGIVGMGFIEWLTLLEKDPPTQSILLLGEVGSMQEQQAAHWIKRHRTKPIFAYIAGRHAMMERRDLPGGFDGEEAQALFKIETLQRAGVTIIDRVSRIGEVIGTR